MLTGHGSGLRIKVLFIVCYNIMKNKKGAIYYTDFHADEKILKACQAQLRESFSGEIISVTLGKSLALGKNIVLKNEKRSYPTMIKQILIALENSTADYVYFTESDVLYHSSHFDFIPPEDNIFYYNNNVLRWYYKTDKAITYDRMLPLSVLCVNRKFVLDHYRMRQDKIEEMGLDKFRSREPRLARRWGYEPGTKKKKRGGLTNDDFDTWSSEYPVIDVRHNKTFSSPKIHLKDFKHQPKNWREINIDKISGWNLKQLFKKV